MPKLLFEPSINRIGEDEFLIAMKHSEGNGRLVMKANALAAFIVEAMWPEKTSRDQLAAAVEAAFPSMTPQEASEAVDGVISVLRKANPQKEQNTDEQEGTQ